MCYPLGLRSCTPHTHFPTFPLRYHHQRVTANCGLIPPLLPLSHLHLPPSLLLCISSLLLWFSSSRHIFVVYFSQFCYFVLYGLSPFPSTKPSHFFLLHIIASTSENMSGHLFPHSYHHPPISIKRHFPSHQRPCPPNNIAFHFHCIHDASRFSWSLMTEDGDDDGGR